MSSGWIGERLIDLTLSDRSTLANVNQARLQIWESRFSPYLAEIEARQLYNFQAESHLDLLVVTAGC